MIAAIDFRLLNPNVTVLVVTDCARKYTCFKEVANVSSAEDFWCKERLDYLKSKVNDFANY